MLSEQAEDRPLLRIEDVFLDNSFRRRLARKSSDKKVAQFWFSCVDETSGEQSLSNITPHIVAKFTQLTGSPQVRRFLGRQESRIDFREAMDSGKIIVISLSKGDLGEYAARFLGALCPMDISGAALSGSSIAAEERRHFRVYIDEFQNLAIRSAGDLLAECRKYNLSLTLVNQSLSQIGGDRFTADISHATLANCGSVAAFRTGPYDTVALAPLFGTAACELPGLATGEFLIRRLSDGEPQPVQRLFGVRPPNRPLTLARFIMTIPWLIITLPWRRIGARIHTMDAFAGNCRMPPVVSHIFEDGDSGALVSEAQHDWEPRPLPAVAAGHAAMNNRRLSTGQSSCANRDAPLHALADGINALFRRPRSQTDSGARAMRGS